MTEEKKQDETKTPENTKPEEKKTLLNRMISEAQKVSTLLEGRIRKQLTENKVLQKLWGMFEQIKTNNHVEKATQELKQISDKVGLKVFQKKA